MAIKILSQMVANRIAAGEVVERPASVVKELVENSFDSGADKIKVEIDNGGISKIVVSDNGCGISKDDLPLAFLPHATSKISTVEDLDSISTMGFRGEALASIASVSKIFLTTKTRDSENGYKIDATGGNISKISEIARLDGTTLCVENLFFNTPVRAKFLKKPKSEEAEVTHLIEKFMLSHPEISFCYVVDGKEVYNHASGELSEVIYLLYGREVLDNLLKLDYVEDGISVGGYIVSPKLSRPNRTYQSLFVNNRYVENYMISACIQGAFEPVLMKGRFPIYVIKLSVPFDRVDVNVHPNKKEVKFDNPQKMFGIIRRAVEKALISANLIAEFQVADEQEQDFEKFHIKNELHPAETGFNSFQKSNFDKLCQSEGASYQVSVDSEEKPLMTAKELQKRGIDIINMPDFSSVKSDKTPKNKNGGNIFFDQAVDSVMKEVEISIAKDKDSKIELKIPETKEETFLTASPENIKIVGTVFKTYIITEFDDSIYIIDQHAMHERQLYDELCSQIESKNISKQGLLVPYSFKLSSKDRDIFAEKVENLREIGFDISQNNDRFVISSVPFVLSGIQLSNFVEELLNQDVIKDETASKILKGKLCQTACKHAIRAGDSVSKEQIFYLIKKMRESIPLCPHGRPIIVKISRKDLEKMFKRVL